MAPATTKIIHHQEDFSSSSAVSISIYISSTPVA